MPGRAPRRTHDNRPGEGQKESTMPAMMSMIEPEFFDANVAEHATLPEIPVPAALLPALPPVPVLVPVIDAKGRTSYRPASDAPAPVVVHAADGSARAGALSLSARASGEVRSARDLLGPADLDWDPVLARLAVLGGATVPESVARAVVRSDTGACIGVVGQRYQPLPHQPLADLADALAGCGEGFTFGNAGHRDGGARPFVQLRRRGDLAGREVEHLVSLFTSHDGSLCYTAGLSDTVIICRNTYAHALSQARDGLRIRHTSGALRALDEAKRIIEAAKEHAASFSNAALALMREQFTSDSMQRLASMLIEGDSTRAEHQRASLMHAWQSGPGAMPGTAWGAAQAVTWYTSHELGRPSSRTDTAIFGTGSGADMQAQAWWALMSEEGQEAVRRQEVRVARA